MTTRRRFLTGFIATVAAPAIVRASSLMPVKARKDYGQLEAEWDSLSGWHHREGCSWHNHYEALIVSPVRINTPLSIQTVGYSTEFKMWTITEYGGFTDLPEVKTATALDYSRST